MPNLRYLGMFINEASDLLSEWEEYSIKLEDGLTDDNLNGLFRTIHTLKGSAAGIGLRRFSECVHSIEDLLSLVSQNPKTDKHDILELLNSGHSFLTNWIQKLKEDAASELDYKPLLERIDKVKKSIVSNLEKSDTQDSNSLPSSESFLVETSEIDFDFLTIFLDEAQDLLNEWEKCCFQLEEGFSQETCNALFRVAHNLKGSSRSVGLQHFADFVHKIEDIITLAQDRKIEVSLELVSTLLSCQEILQQWVHRLKENATFVPDISHAVRTLQHNQVPNAAETKDSGPKNITVPQARSALHKLEDDPEGAFGFFTDALSLPSRPSAKNQLVDDPDGEFGFFVTTPPKGTQKQTAQDPEDANQDHAYAQVGRSIGDRKKSFTEETVRLSTRKLDELLRTIGELAIQNEILRESWENDRLDTQTAQDAITLINKNVKELHDQAIAIRMQPIESLFQRLERTIRDVARRLNKSVRVELIGTNTEIDKGIMDKIKDPLVHIVRNAVDHGLEPSHERLAVRKSLIGKIHLEASAHTGGVYIRISDDGQGMDVERIRKKAIEKGLIGSDTVLSDFEIQQLILLPGFSTAETVTDISGRGVGMDVVKQAVSNLGGNIQIFSKTGLGTTFQINVPSNLSIVQSLVVQVGGTGYVVPIADIQEVLNLAEIPIESTAEQTEYLVYRDQMIPLELLDNYIPGDERPNRSPLKNHEYLSETDHIARNDNFDTDKINQAALLALVKDKMVAFKVERILGQQAVMIRPLEGNLSKTPGIIGSTILNNGEPGMIINLPFLAKDYLEHAC